MNEEMSRQRHSPHDEESIHDSHTWDHLRNRFLSSRPASVQARVFDLASRTAEQLRAWAVSYPSMRQARIRPLCLSVAAAAPFSEISALLSTARMSMWVFALDDLFDEGALPVAKLKHMATRFQSIIVGGKPRQEEEMGRALAYIRDDLKSYPLLSALEATWLGAVSGTIREMVREAEWRRQFRRLGSTSLPSYDDYLACGRYSIGGPPHVWSALITIGDQSTPSHLGALEYMEELASTCIRLANDLQSHRKELAEGKINSLTILCHQLSQANRSPDEVSRLAREMVRQEISRRLDQLIQLQTEVKTETGFPEMAIVNIAQFVCDFYARHDFHTFDDEID